MKEAQLDRCEVCGWEIRPKPSKTLLDEFAMAAMQGIMSNPSVAKEFNGGELSKPCYDIAAAMMKERARRDEMGNVKEVE